MRLWHPSKTKTVLISGASRGLGLEFVKQYAIDEFHVIACCRSPSDATALQQLKAKHKHIEILPLDVTSANSIDDLVTALKDRPIDILINNAGIYGQPRQILGNLDIEDLIKVFATNALSALKISEALVPNLKAGELKLIASITSLMGSISDNRGGGAYAYRSSKAALNMLMKTLAIDLEPLGIRVLLLHPGWVQTDMGGAKAPIEPSTSITGMRKVISSFEGSGVFYDYLGHNLQW